MITKYQSPNSTTKAILKNIITITLLACEDALRENLSAMISSTYGYQVLNTYKSYADLIDNLKTERPDVVFAVTDCDEEQSLVSTYKDVIRKIKDMSPQTKLIVFTHIETQEAIFGLLQAGVDGYITRNSSPVQVLESIKEVYQGGAPLSPSIAKTVVSSFHKNTSSLLTPREIQVLELLAKGKTHSLIARQLSIDKETVRTHMKNIYWKLEVHSKSSAIEKALYEKII